MALERKLKRKNKQRISRIFRTLTILPVAKPLRSSVQVPSSMLLLTPGPVTTRPEVREALRYDFAPWDDDFRPLYAGVRERAVA